jgi:Flp pilus assembly pilin Flp
LAAYGDGMTVRLSRILSRLARCRKGAAAVEYMLLIALITCAVLLATTGLGANVNGTMTAVQKELPSNMTMEIRTGP